MKYSFLPLLGLSEKEQLVYNLLVTYGALSISDIVNRSTLHRPYAYKTIGLLLQKNIVSSVRSGKRKLYTAKRPNELKKEITSITEKAFKELDVLDESYTAPHLETIVKTFQGKSAITSIFNDMVHSLKKGDIFYRYTSESDTAHVDSLLPKDYRAIRDKKDLERFVISNFSSASTKKARLNRAMKIIPKNENQFNQDCIQLIYGNSIAFIDIQEQQGIIIENKNLAQFQKEIFKLLYKRL